MDIHAIEKAVRAHASSWQTLFRREGAMWQCILLPRALLTVAEYEGLVRRLSAPVAFTLEDRRRNSLRARATRKDGGRYV